MKQGWRWYGDADAITLKEIRQAGVTDVVAALYERKPGEVWPVAEIKARAKKVKDAGMTWSVVESVPVHEDIKKRTGSCMKYVANYKQTLRNLAKCGIRTVCYNFMPVLDWTRSNLTYALAATRAVVAGEMSVLSDGAHVVSFDTVVKTMLETGHDLPRLYRETSDGGLSRFVHR